MVHLEKIIIIENVLVRLIKYENYFDLCSGHDGEFWPIVQNSIGEAVCLFWCHIFGNRSDDLHYTQFFDKEAQQLTSNDFNADKVKARMLSAMGLDEHKYKELWQEVKDCRDRFVAHKDLGASVKFPRIDLCRKQSEELRRILSEFATLAYENQPETDWDSWHTYYSNQDLDEPQFKSKCEYEFKNGITNLTKELTRRST